MQSASRVDFRSSIVFVLHLFSDLRKVSKALDFMLFADNTNKLYSRQDPNQLMESFLLFFSSKLCIIFIQNKTKEAET